jgi:hypothetical protein
MTKKNNVDLQEIRTRNLALLFVPRADFMALFKTGAKWRANTVITNGVPADSEVIGVFAAAERDGVMMLLMSPEFEPVLEGAMPPILPIKIDVS